MDEQLIFAAPPIEVWIDRDKKEYHLSFALPGVELPGPFERTVRLPNSVDVGKLTARHSNGTVEIVAPLKEMAPEKEMPQKGS